MQSNHICGLYVGGYESANIRPCGVQSRIYIVIFVLKNIVSTIFHTMVIMDGYDVKGAAHHKLKA